MTSTMHTDPSTDTTIPATPLVADAVGTSFKAYVVLSAVALTGVAAVAAGGHPVNTFMWVRGILLPVVAVVLYRLTVAASRGSRQALDRVRTLSVVMPVAVVAVDLIPGVCPLWYAALQALCMIPVVVAAVALRNRAGSR